LGPGRGYGRAMSEFLVEVYVSRVAAPVSTHEVEQVTQAADRLTHEGTEVRFLRAIFVPDEETCFYLYQGPSVDAVREAAARAGLRVERVAEAMSDPTVSPARASDGLAQTNAEEATQ
jgi:Nickel responsive protein SCO4226-like